MTTTTKAKALRIAKEYSIPVYNVDCKSASDILNEVAEHQLHMALLDERTVFSIQGAAKRNLLKLAKRYNVPYSEDDVNSGALRNQIERYQDMLIRAKQLHIDWNESEYEPVYLRQLIEEAEHDGFRERESLRSFYRESIRLA